MSFRYLKFQVPECGKIPTYFVDLRHLLLVSSNYLNFFDDNANFSKVNIGNTTYLDAYLIPVSYSSSLEIFSSITWQSITALALGWYLFPSLCPLPVGKQVILPPQTHQTCFLVFHFIMVENNMWIPYMLFALLHKKMVIVCFLARKHVSCFFSRKRQHWQCYRMHHVRLLFL